MHRILPLFALAFALGCSSDGTEFQLTTNEPGTFDADWIGDGDSISESFTWENPQPYGEYAMDITAAAGGAMEVEIEDADGTVLNTLRLESGVGDDSRDGLTAQGAAGEWTITITLEDFTGDGTFDIHSVNPDDI